MNTMVAQGTRKAFSAAAAVAIVSFGALALDQAHLASAPRGTIEVGELTALDGQATLAQLPEVVVVAKREASMVAKDDGRNRAQSPAISAGF